MPCLREIQPDAVLILGDTNSCLAAISAKRQKIPVFHMEAGNRCFDQRVPEEINRRIVDHISDINMPYSAISREYLLREGLPPDRVIMTGSPMYEVLHHYLPKIEASDVLDRLELAEQEYYVVSAHREENVDDPAQFAGLIDVLATWPSTGRRVIVSTHPRTRKRIEAEGVSAAAAGRADEAVRVLRLRQAPDERPRGALRQRHHHRGVLDPQLPRAQHPPGPRAARGHGGGAVMMVGLTWERVSEGLAVLETQPRGERTRPAHRGGLRRAQRLREGRADHFELHRLRQPRGVAEAPSMSLLFSLRSAVLILTQWYPPEPALLLQELAQSLQARGHEVAVLTGFPNYPSGELYPGYRYVCASAKRSPVCQSSGYRCTRSTAAPAHAGCSIMHPLRCPPPCWARWPGQRPDVIFVYHPPLTIGLPPMS